MAPPVEASAASWLIVVFSVDNLQADVNERRGNCGRKGIDGTPGVLGL